MGNAPSRGKQGRSIPATCDGLITAVNVPELSGTPGTATPEVVAEVGNPQLVAQTLFERYVLPFEVTSILLLIAMIGAVTLAKREARQTMTRPAGEISASLKGD